MSNTASVKRPSSWLYSLRKFLHPRVLTMLFLGFSAGLPYMLIFSTLSIWLREAGVARSSVTFFSWAALGYSFKFIWAPLVDKIPLPILSRRLGRRRSWLLIAQLLVIAAILFMAGVDPSGGTWALTVMGGAAVLLGFSAATQDIVIDAYRIECVKESEMQALLASTYVAGYRIANIASGAGSLFIASLFGTTMALYHYSAWRNTYCCMALLMLVGVLTTLRIPEPGRGGPSVYPFASKEYLRLFIGFLCACAVFVLVFFMSGELVSAVKNGEIPLFCGDTILAGFLAGAVRLVAALALAGLAFYLLVSVRFLDRHLVSESYVLPVRNFFVRYGLQTAVLLLLLIGFYRISDIVLGIIANIFYTDMGFSKNAIAAISKSYGMVMTLLGGFLGGILTLRYGVYRILFLGALLSAGTNLLFLLLAGHSGDLTLLAFVIAADNLSGGLASTAFIAFLSSLTSVSFTAVQYALFSSLMTLIPKLFGGYSGTIVEGINYNHFFIFTTLLCLPVLVLIVLAAFTLGRRERQADAGNQGHQ